MKLTLEVLFNDPNVVKAVIDRSVATQQDEIFWKRYLDFEETKSRVFKTYLGTVTGVTAGSVIDRNSNKPLRERNHSAAVMEKWPIWATVIRWTTTAWI